MNYMVVQNIVRRSLIISPISLGYFFLYEHQILPSLFVHFLTILKDKSVNTLYKFLVLMEPNILGIN
jgi:hypothetical protein